MKQTLFSLALLALVVALAGVTPTARSMHYGGSFLQRCDGVDALYWNPAHIGHSSLRTGDLLYFNLCYAVRNNLLTLSEYNDTVGETLTEEDEDKLLDDAPAVISVSGESHMTIIGWAKDRNAISIGLHIYGSGDLQREYLELVFRGNEFGQTYTFDNSRNGFTGLSYADISYGVGGYNVNDWLPGADWLPETYFGFTASMLIGLAAVETSNWKGELATDDDGLSLHQNVDMRLGIGGIGLKGLLGLSSQVSDDLTLGLALDNVGGFISWQGESQERTLSADADSLLLAELDDDFLEQENKKLNDDGYAQTLPLHIALGALYTWRNATFSADLQQYVNESPLGNAKPTLSLGAEYMPLSWLATHMGWSMNRDRDGEITLGLGYRHRKWEIDLSAAPDKSIVPTGGDKHVAWSLSWRLKY